MSLQTQLTMVVLSLQESPLKGQGYIPAIYQTLVMMSISYLSLFSQLLVFICKVEECKYLC